ncbi:MAG: transposase [Candidatus Nitrosopolaris sp.]
MTWFDLVAFSLRGIHHLWWLTGVSITNHTENNTLKRVIADGAYDNNENFQYLSDKNIEAAIKVRKNSSYDRSIGCYPRKRVVLKKLEKNGRLKLVIDLGGWLKQYSRH